MSNIWYVKQPLIGHTGLIGRKGDGSSVSSIESMAHGPITKRRVEVVTVCKDRSIWRGHRRYELVPSPYAKLAVKNGGILPDAFLTAWMGHFQQKIWVVTNPPDCQKARNWWLLEKTIEQDCSCGRTPRVGQRPKFYSLK